MLTSCGTTHYSQSRLQYGGLVQKARMMWPSWKGTGEKKSIRFGPKEWPAGSGGRDARSFGFGLFQRSGTAAAFPTVVPKPYVQYNAAFTLIVHAPRPTLHPTLAGWKTQRSGPTASHEQSRYSELCNNQLMNLAFLPSMPAFETPESRRRFRVRTTPTSLPRNLLRDQR